MLFDTRIFIDACHLASFYILIGLLSNNLAYPGPRAWTEESPNAKDHVFLEEQSDQL